jgi:flagellar protein FlbD
MPADPKEGADVIVLHRLGHEAEPFHLNPDMILTLEATPDTVVTLTTGAKVVVLESPERVAEEIRRYRAGILDDALRGRRPALRAIEGSPPPADHPG